MVNKIGNRYLNVFKSYCNHFRGQWRFSQAQTLSIPFRLYKSGNLSENFAVIGTARRPWSKEYFESVVVESITDLADSPQQAQEFASHFYYQSHDVNDTEHYIALRELQNSLDEKYQTEHNKVFFLSMAPQFFGTIAKHLKSEGIVDGQGFERLIVENLSVQT